MATNEIDIGLDQAVAFLQGGVQRPNIEAGLRVIETWEQRLAASESPELLPIAAESDVGAPVADKLSQLGALLTDQGNALTSQ